MKALQIRMRSGMLGSGRFVARLEHGVDRDGGAPPAAFAEVIVALVGGNAQKPVLKGRIAAILAKLEVGLDENVLADVFELGGILGETAGHAEDAGFVPEGELGEGMVVPAKRGVHELLVRS